jgi:hypothetical protein
MRTSIYLIQDKKSNHWYNVLEITLRPVDLYIQSIVSIDLLNWGRKDLSEFGWSPKGSSSLMKCMGTSIQDYSFLKMIGLWDHSTVTIPMKNNYVKLKRRRTCTLIDIIIFNGFRFKVLFPLYSVNFVKYAPYIIEKNTKRNCVSNCSITMYRTSRVWGNCS